MSLIGVPFNEVLGLWPGASKLLNRAIEMSGGRLSQTTVLEALLNREMQLWLAPEGAMVTQIKTYPTGMKVVILLLVGGTMSKWLHFLPEIEAWAHSLGCSVAEIEGRKGWARILKDWTETTVSLERRL